MRITLMMRNYELALKHHHIQVILKIMLGVINVISACMPFTINNQLCTT
jgi:hypothetical protein